MDEADDVVNIDNIEDHLLSCLFFTLGDIGGQTLPSRNLAAPFVNFIIFFINMVEIFSLLTHVIIIIAIIITIFPHLLMVLF